MSLNEELGIISPNIYGHFTENLGRVIYDGIWVGENSKVAKIGGRFRKCLKTDNLGQMITLRDGVVSAQTLDIFNRHPEKVGMANCAQMINCLKLLYEMTRAASVGHFPAERSSNCVK